MIRLSVTGWRGLLGGEWTEDGGVGSSAGRRCTTWGRSIGGLDGCGDGVIWQRLEAF